jgi:ethanolamine-phosphate cytidylyltransferase
VGVGVWAEPNPFLQSCGDPYAVAKEMGIFELVASPRSMTTSTIVDRIVANRGAFEQRNARKAASEAAYYQDKAFVGEI